MSQALKEPRSALGTQLTISLKEAAEALGCDPRTVSAAAAAGTIPSIRLGRRIVIPREKFLKLFEVNDD